MIKSFLTQLHQDCSKTCVPRGSRVYNSLRKVKNINGIKDIYEGSHKLGLLNAKNKKRNLARVDLRCLRYF